jgi:protease-4
MHSLIDRRLSSLGAWLLGFGCAGLLALPACAGAAHSETAAAAAPRAKASPAEPRAPQAPTAPATTAAPASTTATTATTAGTAQEPPAVPRGPQEPAAAAGTVAKDDKAKQPETPRAPRLVELTVSGNVAEDPVPENPLGLSRRNFRSKLLLLRQIAADPDVDGVELHVEGAPDFAHAIDLLEELRRVKAAGKTIVCYAEALDQRTLMFASLADHLAVPPSGLVALEGLQAELMYLKDMFDKIDVRFEVMHVGDFKTAFEDFAKNAMSEEQRQVIGLLLDEFYDQMLETIASQRGMERGALEGLYEQVLVRPELAQEAGLIDAVAFADEFDAKVHELLGGKAERVEHYGDKSKEELEQMLSSPFAAFSLLPKLLNPPKRKAPKEPHVAIVYATGVITSGKSQTGWDGTVASMGSETIVEALEKALENDDVKAVVLRVNSPGGSALASDMIWRAIQRVKEQKPVVSSMGNVAASGGYWISMGCSAIVAQPSTITGSMGVVSMLPDFSKALGDLGINVEVVARGPHGDQLSLLKHGPTDVLRGVIARMMDDVYEDFLEKASKGRRMDKARVAELAKGRVWTGRQAEELGLIDELGGLQDAIDLACVMGGGLDPGKAPIMEYPEAPSFMEAIEQAFEDMALAQAALPEPVGTLLRHPAFAAYEPTVRELLTEMRGVHADRVQCLLPFVMTVR